MKKLILAAAATLFSGSVFCAVTVHYDNRDDQGYTMTVKIDGEYKDVKVEMGGSGDMVIKGGQSACTFLTKCGEVVVNDGDRIMIKDRCITVYKTMQQNYKNWTNY